MLCLLALLALGAALDCKSMNLDKLDTTFFYSQVDDTPPTQTETNVYFNPCGPVDAKECAADSHYCVIERVQSGKEWVVSSVKNFGSAAAGAVESVRYGKTTDATGEHVSFLSVGYNGGKWGTQELHAEVRVICSQNQIFDLVVSDGSYVFGQLSTPSVCGLEAEDPENPPEPDPSEPDPSKPDPTPGRGADKKKSGWGFFRWLWVISLVFLVIYAALTIHLNAARSGHQIQVASTLRDIISDLPYLLGDLVRKVRSFFSGSRSGYSAV